MAMPSPWGVPDWIETHTGSAPLLLLAPHGGRRAGTRHPGRHKVNDLHTAELTRELAAACDATSVVNGTRDRNELDLNRISQVCERGRWLLDLLADTLEAMLARSPRATVVVIHGWNVVQPACDVGAGVVVHDGRYVPAAEGQPTASDAFLDGTVGLLRRLAEPASIVVTIGARYPGAHRNNLLQLFTPTHRDHSDATVRKIAALAPRVDAAQLELGIPLRWPGPRRATFVDLLTRVFDGRRAESVPTPATEGSALACGGHATARQGIQFAQDGLLGFTSIDTAGDGGVAGRLLVSPTSDELALFTGELAERGDGALTIPGLEYTTTDAGGMRVRFEGPLLSFPTLTPFLDLEHGLARGHLVEAALDLSFTPARAEAPAPQARGAFGTLQGWLALDGTRRTISTVAQGLAGPLAVPDQHFPFARFTLPATPLGHLALVSEHASDPAPDPDSSSLRARRFQFALTGTAWRNDGSRTVAATCDLTLTPSGGQLRLDVDAAGETRVFTAALERLIPVRRPGRARSVVLTVFALCVPSGGPAGWIEVSTQHPAAPSAGPPPRES